LTSVTLCAGQSAETYLAQEIPQLWQASAIIIRRMHAFIGWSRSTADFLPGAVLIARLCQLLGGGIILD